MSSSKGESYWLIQFIRVIVGCPRLIIIVPALIVFVIGYSTTYDFTVHSANCLFARYHLQHHVAPAAAAHDFSGVDLAQSALTTVTFGSPNVLTYEFMTGLARSCDRLHALNGSAPVVLAPWAEWSLQKIDPNAYNHYLLHKINYDSSFLLAAFYLDDVAYVNHLVVGARGLKVYLVHSRAAAGELAAAVAALPHVRNVSTVDSPRIVAQFAHYYTTIRSDYRAYLDVLLSAAVVSAVAVFVVSLYLSISNAYKIKSSFGLVFGWLIEVLISMAAAVSIVTYFNTGGSVRLWKQLFEPTTVYSRSMYFLTVAMLSSRNLVRMVNDLAVETEQQEANLQSLLYKFYVGIANNFNREDQSKIAAVKRLLTRRELRLVTKRVDFSKLRAPTITKVLLVDLLSLAVLKYTVLLILRCFFAGNFLEYFVMKISRFFLVCSMALVIDHLMQLTYLMGIVLIDLHKHEVTDILNENVHNNYNIFSKYLLNFKLMDDTDRKSIRYRLGTALLLIRYPTSLKSWFFVVPIIQLINIVIMALTWSLKIPYNLFNENLDLLSFPTLKVVQNSADFLYYLEFLSILVLIIASSIITFELSDFKIEEKAKEKVDSIQLFEEKTFNCIDLKAHDLDPVRIKTTNESPFLLSVGLDHRVLIWSPLKVPLSKPINIASNILIKTTPFEFWPINHVNLNKDGNFIVLISFKFNVIRCFSRSSMQFSWSKRIDAVIDLTKVKIVESFFREKTVPAFLKRKMMQKKQSLGQPEAPPSRRGSVSSVRGNFPNLISATADDDKKSLLKYEFVVVTNTGDIMIYNCDDGKEDVTNIIEAHYDESDTDIENLRLVSVKKIITPRVNDRIVCQVNNGDILVAIAINNKWKITEVELQVDYYDKVVPLIPLSAPMSRQNSMSYDFGAGRKPDHLEQAKTALKATQTDFSKTFIYPIEFVGMIMRVNNLQAELIDVQTGIVMLKLNVGYFKPASFRVAHAEPTHCRFCGCASIQSFSVIYEEFDSQMLIIHTFKIKEARSRTNICLRVERDPREIRCAGFNSASEDQLWYSDIDAWEVNDINMILGVKRDPEETEVEYISESRQSTSVEVHGNGFNAIRSRSSKKRNEETKANPREWEGFVITLTDGKLTNYKIPDIPKNLITNKIHCVEKFGFKAIAVNFGGLIKILYLGNNKLIEENLYFNDGTTGGKSGPAAANKPINNELLFINKRRKFKGK